VTEVERLELQRMIAQWRRYTSFTQEPSYDEGVEAGHRSAADDLEEFLCITDN
jgi:hypothetical protein